MKLGRILAGIGLMAVVGAGCSDTPLNPVVVTTGTVAGSVKTDSAFGVWPAGVELLRGGTVLSDTVSANILMTTTTDINGDFRISLVTPGSYVVRVVPLFYSSALLSSEFSVTAGSTTNIGTMVVPRAP